MPGLKVRKSENIQKLFNIRVTDDRDLVTKKQSANKSHKKCLTSSATAPAANVRGRSGSRSSASSFASARSKSSGRGRAGSRGNSKNSKNSSGSSSRRVRTKSKSRSVSRTPSRNSSRQSSRSVRSTPSKHGKARPRGRSSTPGPKQIFRLANRHKNRG